MCLISPFINIQFTIIEFIWYITVKPRRPIITDAVCEETSASVEWKSSFDGGAVQSFFVAAFGDAYKSSRSDIIKDKGENQTHQAVVPFLQPSVLYTFYVFAKNSIGVTLSEELNCTTFKGIVISSSYAYIFVCVFTSHSRIFHSYGNVITSEGLPIFTFTWHSWPLSSEAHTLGINTDKTMYLYII